MKLKRNLTSNQYSSHIVYNPFKLYFQYVTQSNSDILSINLIISYMAVYIFILSVVDHPEIVHWYITTIITFILARKTQDFFSDKALAKKTGVE